MVAYARVGMRREGSPWTDLPEEEREAWRQGVMDASAVLAGAPIRLSVPTDLGQTAFDWVRHILGGPPPESCTIVASSYLAEAMREVVACSGADSIEIPVEMLKARSAWAILGGGGCAWSEGLD